MEFQGAAQKLSYCHDLMPFDDDHNTNSRPVLADVSGANSHVALRSKCVGHGNGWAKVNVKVSTLINSLPQPDTLNELRTVYGFMSPG
jgi:hypothetical protein